MSSKCVYVNCPWPIAESSNLGLCQEHDDKAIAYLNATDEERLGARPCPSCRKRPASSRGDMLCDGCRKRKEKGIRDICKRGHERKGLNLGSGRRCLACAKAVAARARRGMQGDMQELADRFYEEIMKEKAHV